MNEPEKKAASPDESLADAPPTPVEEARVPLAGNIGMGTVALTLAGAGAIALVASSMSPTMGATRSTKLEWERRILQIEQAEREAQALSEPVAQPDDRSDAQPSVGKQD